MNRFFLIPACAALFSCAGQALDVQKDSVEFKLILVRHAEKTAGTDPGLTELGQHRSEFISRWLGDSNLKTIWSSDYRRSRDTAEPLAQELEIEISFYDPRMLQEFSVSLIQAQDNALVIGHSNTTPQLAALLCNCEIEAMDETQYERAYIVSRGSGHSSLNIIDFTQEWKDRSAKSD